MLQHMDYEKLYAEPQDSIDRIQLAENVKEMVKDAQTVSREELE